MSAAILSFVFVVLWGFHIYWLLGGTIGVDIVVPEHRGIPLFRPRPVSTACVALGLLLAACICAAQGELLGFVRSPWSRGGVWVLAVVFALRAIGEFRFLGFFKRVRRTRFATMDTWVFAPLCLAISLLCAHLLVST